MKHPADESWRCNKAAKHLLAALVFTESSRAAHDKAGVYLLPHIGHYYAAFHLSVAALALMTSVPRAELTRITHKNLRAKIMELLVKPKHIKKKYYDIYERLREIREEANYKVPLVSELRQKLLDPYKAIDTMFRLALPHIHSAADAVPGGSLFDIQVWIGDGFGDDLKDEYCTRRLHKLITQRCVDYQLTT
jgi:uncharacterized protein (UPF0332 family)